MRNRGVEIFMPGTDDSYFQEDEDEEVKDTDGLGRSVITFLYLSSPAA